MILVTGATGRVGSAVVRTLRRLNLDVRSLVRKGSEYYWLNDTACQYHFGDLRDPNSLRRACRDMKYLVICSGVQVESRENNHTTVTVEGHAALLEAAKERGIGRVVLISCMGVDRGLPVPAFDARKGAEELLIHSGLDYTILRACVHEHIFVEMAAQVAEKGYATLAAAGDNRISPVPTTDLAMMAAASLDLDAVRNQTIEVGGAEIMTARAAFERACAVAGVTPEARVLPGPAVALGRRLGRPVRRYAHRLGEMHAWLSQEFVADPEASGARFGIPLTSFDDALRAAHQTHLELSDPELREQRMVHPQFYATVYRPGEAPLADLPSGPPPRRD